MTTIRATHRTTRGVLRTRGAVMLTTHLTGLTPVQRTVAVAQHAQRVRAILAADRGAAPLPAQPLSPLERETGKVAPLARTWCAVGEARADLWRVRQTIARLESGYLPDDETTARALAEAREREAALHDATRDRPTLANRRRAVAKARIRREAAKAQDPPRAQRHAEIEALREAARKAAGDDHTGAHADSWHDVPRRPPGGAAVAA